LTPGQTYKFKLFLRPWEVNATRFRSIDLRFTNGITIEEPFGGLATDRPALVLNNSNDHSAYYLSYTYVAETTQLVVRARIHESSPIDNGSIHLYGLTNEEAAAPTGNLAITGVSRNGLGEIVINFTGALNTTYKVTKSPDLVTSFGPLTIPLTALTDPAGIGQAIVPATETTESKEFYRIEEIP
jgi:hypothetical protein